jgi:hypothetical protein
MDIALHSPNPNRRAISMKYFSAKGLRQTFPLHMNRACFGDLSKGGFLSALALHAQYKL